MAAGTTGTTVDSTACFTSALLASGMAASVDDGSAGAGLALAAGTGVALSGFGVSAGAAAAAAGAASLIDYDRNL